MPFIRKSLATAAIISALLLLGGCGAKDTGGKIPAPAADSSADSLTIELAGRDGISVLELTLESHTIVSYESALGTFVEAIDSVKADGGYWWLFTVNDSTVNTASDKCITKDGDIVRWHFKKP
jgi:hypothetical protein